MEIDTSNAGITSSGLIGQSTIGQAPTPITPTPLTSNLNPSYSSSYSFQTPVVSSKAAANDLNSIKTQHADITQGMQDQQAKITADQQAKEAQAKADQDRAAADKAAADKLAAQNGTNPNIT